MPRASSQSSKASKSGFGMQDGIVKVVEAAFTIHQFATKEGDIALSFFGTRFDYVRSDEDGVVENPEDVMQQFFIIQIVGKDKDSGELDFGKLKFHPGKAKNADDADPEDLCEGVKKSEWVGIEGNSMWVESASATPFQDADWIEFCQSLEKKGWKPEINDQSYAPNYVGTVFKFHTENKKLRPNAKADAKVQTRWVVDQIYVRPYEGTGKGKKSAATSSAKTDTGKSSEAGSSGANGAASTGDAETTFQAALTKLISDPAPATKTVSKGLAAGVKLNDFYRAIANEASLVRVNGKGLTGLAQKELHKSLKEYDEAEGTGFIEVAGAGVLIVDREKEEVSAI